MRRTFTLSSRFPRNQRPLFLGATPRDCICTSRREQRAKPRVNQRVTDSAWALRPLGPMLHMQKVDQYENVLIKRAAVYESDETPSCGFVRFITPCSKVRASGGVALQSGAAGLRHHVAAGHAVVHRHCIGRLPTQCRRHSDHAPRNPDRRDASSTFGLLARRSCQWFVLQCEPGHPLLRF